MYTLKTNPRSFIIMQHTPCGDYVIDRTTLSVDAAIERAWESEKGEDWVKEHTNINDAKAEFLGTIVAYSDQEALQAAQNGYGWPEKFGFVTPTPYPTQKAIVAADGEVLGLANVMNYDTRVTIANAVVDDIHGGHNIVNAKMYKLSVSARNMKKASKIGVVVDDYLSNAGFKFYVFRDDSVDNML